MYNQQESLLHVLSVVTSALDWSTTWMKTCEACVAPKCTVVEKDCDLLQKIKLRFFASSFCLCVGTSSIVTRPTKCHVITWSAFTTDGLHGGSAQSRSWRHKWKKAQHSTQMTQLSRGHSDRTWKKKRTRKVYSLSSVRAQALETGTQMWLTSVCLTQCWVSHLHYRLFCPSLTETGDSQSIFCFLIFEDASTRKLFRVCCLKSFPLKHSIVSRNVTKPLERTLKAAVHIQACMWRCKKTWNISSKHVPVQTWFHKRCVLAVHMKTLGWHFEIWDWVFQAPKCCVHVKTNQTN